MHFLPLRFSYFNLHSILDKSVNSSKNPAKHLPGWFPFNLSRICELGNDQLFLVPLRSLGFLSDNQSYFLLCTIPKWPLVRNGVWGDKETEYLQSYEYYVNASFLHTYLPLK